MSGLAGGSPRRPVEVGTAQAPEGPAAQLFYELCPAEGALRVVRVVALPSEAFFTESRPVARG